MPAEVSRSPAVMFEIENPEYVWKNTSYTVKGKELWAIFQLDGSYIRHLPFYIPLHLNLSKEFVTAKRYTLGQYHYSTEENILKFQRQTYSSPQSGLVQYVLSWDVFSYQDKQAFTFLSS